MESLALIRPDGASVELPKKPVRVLGIDLGTTNSTIAELIWNPDDPASSVVRCLEIDQPTSEGIYTHVLIPSVVAIHEGKVIVGEGAKRLRARAAELKLEQNQNLFYDCKNDIGTQRTYHRAPEGFRSAAEIGGKVLSFLQASAMEIDDAPVERIVVTVPASFQAAQRNDTLKAAEFAGIRLSGGDLLDEPVAAFLDYIVTYGSNLVRELREPKKLVVFDFGGGTCDVAVFKIRSNDQGGRIQIDPLAADTAVALLDRCLVCG